MTENVSNILLTGHHRMDREIFTKEMTGPIWSVCLLECPPLGGLNSIGSAKAEHSRESELMVGLQSCAKTTGVME